MDLKFLSKELKLLQEEKIALKSQVERLEAEVEKIKGLHLQKPDLLQKDNQLENKGNVDANGKHTVNLKILSNTDMNLEMSSYIQSNDDISSFKSTLNNDNEFFKIVQLPIQQNGLSHKSYERKVNFKTNLFNNHPDTHISKWELDDSKTIASVDSQTESLKNTDTILQKNSFSDKLSEKKIITETNPNNLLLSDSFNTEISSSVSIAGTTSLNFQNDFFENINSISEQNSVSFTSTKPTGQYPPLKTFLPKCLRKNYSKCKFFRKSVKTKQQVKQKWKELKNISSHTYTTRSSVNLSKAFQTPVFPKFLTHKISDKEQNSSDSEDSLPDLEDSILKEFSELDDDTNVMRKSTLKPFLTLPDTIPMVVSKILQAPISDCKLEDHIQKCINELEDYISPDNISNLIFYILKFLFVINKNPIIDYMKHKNSSLFLIPIEDSFIAYILVQIDAHLKMQNTGFLLSALINMRLLILGMNTMSIDGLCAFCRIFTRICQLKNNEKEPISLCCDILKMKHKFAPMLVASIAVVWKELFDISYEAPEEVTTFYGSISLAARRWPDAVPTAAGKDKLTTEEWEISRFLVEHYVVASPVYPSEDTMNFLFDSIEEKWIKEPSEEGSMLMNALILFASYKTWSWVRERIIDRYLTPKIKKHSYSVKDADSLTLYCKLYGEICSLNTCSIFKPEKLLMKLFKTGCEDTDYKFLQEASAVALLQLLLSTRKSLPDSLGEWIKQNENNPKFLSMKLLQHRYKFRNKLDFTSEDMLC